MKQRRSALTRAMFASSRDLGDTPAEARAECLLGDVLQAQGKLDEAQAAYTNCLAICRQLAEQDPSNTGRHQGLAATLDRLAEVLQAQGKLSEAKKAAAEAFATSQRLAEQDLTSAGYPPDHQRQLYRVSRQAVPDRYPG